MTVAVFRDDSYELQLSLLEDVVSAGRRPMAKEASYDLPQPH